MIREMINGWMAAFRQRMERRRAEAADAWMRDTGRWYIVQSDGRRALVSVSLAEAINEAHTASIVRGDQPPNVNVWRADGTLAYGWCCHCRTAALRDPLIEPQCVICNALDSMGTPPEQRLEVARTLAIEMENHWPRDPVGEIGDHSV